MTANNFRESLLTHFDKFRRTLGTDTGDWVIKGFVDVLGVARPCQSKEIECVQDASFRP